MFKQNLVDFVSSKTNWVSLISIVACVYGFKQGFISYGEFMTTLNVGLAGLGLRDALAK